MAPRKKAASTKPNTPAMTPKTRKAASSSKPKTVASRVKEAIDISSSDSDVPLAAGRRLTRSALRNQAQQAPPTDHSTTPDTNGFDSASPVVGLETPETSLSDIDVPDLDTPVPSAPIRSKGKGKSIAKAVDAEVDKLDELSEAEEAGLGESELEDFEPVKPASSSRKGKGRALDIESGLETGPPKKRTRVGSGKAKAGPGRVTTRRNFIVSEDEEEEESEFDVAELSSDESEYEEAGETAPVVEAEASDSEPEAAIPPPPPRQRGRAGRLTGRHAREENFFHFHPELANTWTDLTNKPKTTPEEDPQPVGLALDLLPFQKEGLNWLRKQEQSIFKGGILADEMGMGKTIQTLALIMLDPEAKPNLVVAPTVALMQWKSEIEKYCGNALSVYIYHGANRTDDHKVLKKHNVVLTTYSVLESVYRKQQTGFKRKDGRHFEESALHKVKYHRVILDEAHCIKDRTCNTAKAVYKLETKYKLCLSGTPLQNRIGELFSLLRFLEIDPFAYYYCRKCPCKDLHWNFVGNRTCEKCGHPPMSHSCYFNYTLLKPIQRDGNSGEGRVAFQRIQFLLDKIMLRRTKREREEDLGLPPKVIRVRRDKFTEEELDLYDSIYTDGKRKFNTYVAQGVVLNNYANIFTLITRMRQMADHPDLVLRRHSEEGQNNLVCFLCDDEAEDAIISKCHHTFCRSCISDYIKGYAGSGSPECPKCHVALTIDLTQAAQEPDSLENKKNSIVSRIDMSKWRSSTKIEGLCEELYKLRKPHQTTKSIVFSQFTSMLQLIEWRLKRAGFKTVMLEGSMLPSQREATINHFMNTVDVEVFLVSLKAGGVALNLIEANQVFIMDPWWNPAASWQAEDRIHRIGQSRVCQVTRMVIQDSIESRIVELQEKKANMIDATVNADQQAIERLSAADMQFLFQN